MLPELFLKESNFLQPKILLIFLLAMVGFNQLTVAQIVKGTEQLDTIQDQIIFDYRLHRNPANYFKNDIFKNSNYTWNYLYDGNVVARYKEGKFLNKFQRDTLILPPYKLDIQLVPLFLYNFGDFSDPFETQLGVAPRLKWVPAKGFFMVFQWQFPLQNDFRYSVGYGQRPGQIGLGFHRIFRGRYNFSGYFGTLTGNNYGLNLEYLARTKDAHWYYGGAFFFTGTYIYHEQYFYRQFLSTRSGYVQLAYRIHQWDMTVRMIGDIYLNQDKGVTMEVIRQYGNTDIGFYAIAAENATNAGFFFRIRLWPGKFYSNKWMQIRLPNNFQNYYTVRSNSQMPRVRHFSSTFNEMLRFNPAFLNGQLNRGY